MSLIENQDDSRSISIYCYLSTDEQTIFKTFWLLRINFEDKL